MAFVVWPKLLPHITRRLSTCVPSPELVTQVLLVTGSGLVFQQQAKYSWALRKAVTNHDAGNDILQQQTTIHGTV